MSPKSFACWFTATHTTLRKEIASSAKLLSSFKTLLHKSFKVALINIGAACLWLETHHCSALCSRAYCVDKSFAAYMVAKRFHFLQRHRNILAEKRRQSACRLNFVKKSENFHLRVRNPAGETTFYSFYFSNFASTTDARRASCLNKSQRHGQRNYED